MENLKLSKIKPNEKNPRKISKDKLEKLKQSIQEFEIMMAARPIVVDDDNVILGGNMRYTALKALGYKEIPNNWVYKMSDLTEEQKKEFIIKDNVGFGEWDWDILKFEFNEADLVNWGLEFPVEMQEETILEAEEDDYQEPENIEVDVVLGDLIEFECTDGRVHRLICGDSTCSDTVARLMNGEKADMVFTDPPYNISFSGSMSNTTKDGKMIKHKGANQKHDAIHNDKMTDKEFYNFMSDILKEIKINCIGAFYICFGSQTLNQLLQPFLDLGMEYKSIIIWMKNQATLSGKDYKGRYEPILYGRFNDGFYGERYKQEDIWQFQRTLKNDLHPTMKPIPLIENALNNSSKEDMTIMDLFLGSGSTMVASHQLKRKCYGMELDPKYCQVIIDRMKKLDSTIKVKINGNNYDK